MENNTLRYALLDKDNVVINIIVIEKKDLNILPDLIESNNAVKAVEDNLLYKAEIQGSYDGEKFLPHKPYASWFLKEQRFLVWEAPKPQPVDGLIYIWNEDILDWQELQA